jgi:hypothetical protein
VSSDANIIEQTKQAFSTARRPEHFTDFTHCEECQEHDELLRSRDLDTLGMEDVGNPGWDPICFITPQGFRYYFPALARLALEEPTQQFGWYLPQLLFHLTYDGPQSRHLQACSRQQHRAVVAILRHVVETRHDSIVSEGCANELQTAIELWDVA